MYVCYFHIGNRKYQPIYGRNELRRVLKQRCAQVWFASSAWHRSWGNRFRRRTLRFACIIIVVRARRGGVAREILFGGCGSGGRGRGHEARKVKELDARVRLFFALASKNSAAGAVVSRCAHGESSRSRGGGYTTRRRIIIIIIIIIIYHVHVVCVLRRARAKTVGLVAPPVTPTEYEVCARVFCVIVIFKAAAVAASGPVRTISASPAPSPSLALNDDVSTSLYFTLSLSFTSCLYIYI